MLRKAADQSGIILGTAVREEEFLVNSRYRQLVVESFNCIYPENSFKMTWVCVHKGQYDFEMADALVDWAVSQGLNGSSPERGTSGCRKPKPGLTSSQIGGNLHDYMR